MSGEIGRGIIYSICTCFSSRPNFIRQSQNIASTHGPLHSEQRSDENGSEDPSVVESKVGGSIGGYLSWSRLYT